jgi:hypothetical protein
MLWICVRIAGADRSFRSGNDHVVHANTERCQDVALLTVHIEEEGDTRRSVWIVLDGGNASGNPGLVALEVDDPVMALGSTTTVAGGDATPVIATGRLLQRHGKPLFRPLLGDLLERAHTHRAARWGGWLVLANWHSKRSLLSEPRR